MELIELKSAWESLQQEVIKNEKVEEGKIISTIQIKSKSEVSKIKRGLKLKFVLASISVVGLIGLTILSMSNQSLNPLDFIFSRTESFIFFSVMALSISIMVYFNYVAYSQIRAVMDYSLNLKSNLERFIDAMQKAMNFNILSDTIMTPIIFTWAYYAYAFESYGLGFDLRTALLFILPVLIGGLSYFLQRYMQHLKFGKYLKRLHSYLDSIQK